MKQTVRLSERIRGRYERVAPILRLEFDSVIREPLDELRVQVGRSSVGRRVEARVGPPRSSPRTRGVPPGTITIPVSWRAAEHPALFPTMKGELRIAEAGADTIELLLTGEYRTPLGAIGALGERLAGHQAATSALYGYLREVAHRLDAKLAEHAPPFAAAFERAPGAVAVMRLPGPGSTPLERPAHGDDAPPRWLRRGRRRRWARGVHDDAGVRRAAAPPPCRGRRVR